MREPARVLTPAPHTPPPSRMDFVQFSQLRVNIVVSPEERVGLDVMSRAAALREAGDKGSQERFGITPDMSQADLRALSLGEVRALAPDVAALEVSLKRLRRLLELASRYCDEAATGAREGDEAVGRALADTLAAVPPFDADSFQRTFGRSVQDMLMVTYLASLSQAQVKLAERIAQLKPISQMNN